MTVHTLLGCDWQEVFTTFAHSVGCPVEWAWVDVMGLDPELLAMVPQPCAAVILLFPCTDAIYTARWHEAEKIRATGAGAAVTPAFHLTQVAEFGNACGTIASVHALINGAVAFGGFADTADGAAAPLAAYRDSTADQAPVERGKALLHAPGLKATSDLSAQHVAAQTECPSRDGPDLDHHFVAFSPIIHPTTGNVHVVELDGTKDTPVDHGNIKGQTFLTAVAAVIREHYVAVEPDSIEFSMMALCKLD